MRRTAILSALGFMTLFMGLYPSWGQNLLANPGDRSDILQSEADRIRGLLETTKPGPEREDLLVRLASIEMSRGKMENAIGALEEVRKQDGFATNPKKKQILIDLGAYYESYGDSEGALDCYRDYLEIGAESIDSGTGERAPRPLIDPVRDSSVERRYVRALMDVGRYSEAARELLPMVRSDDVGRSSYAAAYIVQIYSMGHISEREIGTIIDVLIGRFPSYAVQLAGVMEQRGRDGDAEYLYGQILEKDPNSTLSAVETMAAFYQRVGKIDKIIAELEKRKATSQAYFLLLIRFYRYTGRPADAVAEIEKWPQRNADPSLQQELGDLYTAMGNHLKAAEAYSEFTRRFPQSSEGWERLGNALFAAGKKDEALIAWRSIPERLGNSPSAWADLSEILETHGFTDEAVEAIRTASAQYPGLYYYTTRLLSLLVHAGKYADAIAVLEREIGQYPQTEVVFIKAFVDDPMTDEVREGLIAAMKARLGATSGPVQVSMLRIMYEIRVSMGRYEDAVREVKNVESLNADVELCRLGEVLKSRGEMKYAREAFCSVDRSSPQFVNARIQGMDVSIEMGDPLGARKIGREVLEYILKDADAASLIADATGNPERILTESRNKLKNTSMLLYADFSRVLYQLARSAVVLKDGAVALELLKSYQMVPGFQRASPGRIDVDAEILRGESYALLGDRTEARKRLLRTATSWIGPTADRGRLLLADLDLWDGNVEAALAGYRAVASLELSSPVVNDALERVHILAQLSPEASSIYARSMDYEWRGRYLDAVEEYRKLSAAADSPYVSDWALYKVGRICFNLGNKADGEKTWQIVLDRTGDSQLKGRILFESLDIMEKDPETPRERIDEGYRRLIEELPDTIFADKARKRISS